MQSISKHTDKETPKLYENMSETAVFLINKINSDGTMRGTVIYSLFSKYKIGDYYDDLELLKPYMGEITLSN